MKDTMRGIQSIKHKNAKLSKFIYEKSHDRLKTFPQQPKFQFT